MKNLQVFIGYDIPLALDVKHQVLFPFMDAVYTRKEIDGDIMHIVPEDKMKHLENVIYAYNNAYDIGLTLDYELYKEDKNE